MDSIAQFQKGILSLCSGKYTREDVRCVVEVFHSEMKRLLMHRETSVWNLRGEWEDGNKEISDIALDFIAPLFSRDETGVFIELQKFFQGCTCKQEREFQDAFYRLLNSTLHQQAIRVFQERDPFGKVFYRSMRYILSKHMNWRKITSRGGPTVGEKNKSSAEATDDQIEFVFNEVSSRVLSLTKRLEEVLVRLVEREGLSVPIYPLLRQLRRQTFQELDSQSDRSEIVENTSLQETIAETTRMTVKEIDEKILQRYEETMKLSPSEREGFKSSIEIILSDFANGECNRTYFEYLKESLQLVETQERYKDRYRTKFEYVAKLAKDMFSANVRADISV